MSRLVVGSATDVGLVRPINQDQLLVAPGLYAVADGMGGHAAGEVASSTAIAALQAAFEASDEHSLETLESAAKAANRAVWEQARANRGMLGMGTTLVALAVVDRRDGTSGLAVAHIGDSRLYLLRDGSLHQLTVDHSLVQELVDDGQISPAQAAVHPQRHVLTRALGVEPSVTVDVLDLQPENGDRYLLCSDGLPREASDDQIAAVLNRFAEPASAAKELVVLAKSRGGSDNITVVIVDVEGNGDAGSPAPGRRSLASSAGGPSLAEDVTVGGDNSARLPADGVAAVPGGAPDEVSGNVPAEGAPTMAVPAAGGARRGGNGAVAAPGPRPAQARPRQAVTDLLERRPQQAPAAPAVPAPAKAGYGAPAHPAHAAASPRRVTWRVIGFVMAVCAVVGGAIGALAWYARSTYYVGLMHNRITVFQGRPGGVLWFDPTVARRTRYTTASVLSYELPYLRAGQLEPSLSQARLYVNRLVSEKVEAQAPVPSSARGAPRHHTAATTATTAVGGVTSTSSLSPTSTSVPTTEPSTTTPTSTPTTK